MFAAFQSNAFQGNAFQIGAAGSILLGGKDYSYHTPYSKYKESEYKAKIKKQKTELQKVDSVITEYEKKKKEATKLKVLANKKLAAENLRLELELEAEINRLLQVRALLLQRIRQNEEALIVILVMARKRLRAA